MVPQHVQQQHCDVLSCPGFSSPGACNPLLLPSALLNLHCITGTRQHSRQSTLLSMA